MADYVKRTFTFDGKRYYVRGKDDIDAEIKRALKIKVLEEGKKEITGKMTVKAWTDEWLKTYKEPMVNSRHLSDIKGHLKNHINKEIGAYQIRSIKPVQLQKILNGMTGFSDSTISKVYDLLRQIFTEAYNNNLIADNPSSAIKKPAGKAKNRRRALTKKERALTKQLIPLHRGGLFIAIMLYCGLRPGEVAALRWSDFDFDKNVIHVSRALKSDDTFGPPKTSAGIRTVPVPDVLLKLLAVEDQSQPFGFVCKNAHGDRYTKTSIRNMWESFKRELNIAAGCRVERNKLMPPYPIADDLTLYCYRHTFCTDLQSAGVPINVARELMGHSNISVTAEIYTHHSEEATKNAADLINAFNSGKKSGVADGVAHDAQVLEFAVNK